MPLTDELKSELKTYGLVHYTSSYRKEIIEQTGVMKSGDSLLMKGLGYEYDRSKYLDGYLVNGAEPQYDLEMSIAAADQFLKCMKKDPELRHCIPNIML